MLFVKLINKYIVDCSSYKKVIILFQLLSIYQIQCIPILIFPFVPSIGWPTCAEIGGGTGTGEGLVRVHRPNAVIQSRIFFDHSFPLCFPCKRGDTIIGYDAAL